MDQHNKSVPYANDLFLDLIKNPEVNDCSPGILMDEFNFHNTAFKKQKVQGIMNFENKTANVKMSASFSSHSLEINELEENEGKNSIIAAHVSFDTYSSSLNKYGNEDDEKGSTVTETTCSYLSAIEHDNPDNPNENIIFEMPAVSAPNASENEERIDPVNELIEFFPGTNPPVPTENNDVGLLVRCNFLIVSMILLFIIYIVNSYFKKNTQDFE